MGNQVFSKAHKQSNLIYLKGIIETALLNANRAYDMHAIDDLWLPTAGREISFTPLLVSAAYQQPDNKFAASSEIKIIRKESGNAGALDLAIFSQKGKRKDAIELKFSSRDLFGSNSVKNILEARMGKAIDQLNDIANLPDNMGKVAMVIHRIRVNPDKVEIEDVRAKAKDLVNEIYEKGDDLLIGWTIFDGSHAVHKKDKDNVSTHGVIIVAQRVE
jgi:hypothetical protein